MAQVHNATKKIDLHWWVAFLRGIGANWVRTHPSTRPTPASLGLRAWVGVCAAGLPGVVAGALVEGYRLQDRLGLVAGLRVHRHRIRAQHRKHVLCAHKAPHRDRCPPLRGRDRPLSVDNLTVTAPLRLGLLTWPSERPG